MDLLPVIVFSPDHAMAYWSQLIDQPEPVTHAVEEITGAPARTFRDWAREHARDFLPPGQDERR